MPSITVEQQSRLGNSGRSYYNGDRLGDNHTLRFNFADQDHENSVAARIEIAVQTEITDSDVVIKTNYIFISLIGLRFDYYVVLADLEVKLYIFLVIHGFVYSF